MERLTREQKLEVLNLPDEERIKRMAEHYGVTVEEFEKKTTPRIFNKQETFIPDPTMKVFVDHIPNLVEY